MNPKTLLAGGILLVLNLVTVGQGSGIGLGLLSPLLPLATITGHAGLYGSGLTSAALLKLKAASAIAALFALNGGGFHFKIGKGWTPDLDHHHGGWHRRRRSAAEADARGETANNPEEPSLDDVLSYDNLGCGMRLVCELAAAPYEQLQDDGKLILELFGRDGKAPNPSKSSKGKLSYSYATILGENAKDASACARVYARCPYDASSILQSLRAANV